MNSDFHRENNLNSYSYNRHNNRVITSKQLLSDFAQHCFRDPCLLESWDFKTDEIWTAWV